MESTYKHHDALRSTLLLGVIANSVLLGYGLWTYSDVIASSSRDIIFVSFLTLTMIAYIAAALAGTTFKTRLERVVGRWACRRGITYGVLIGLIWLARIAFASLAKHDSTLKGDADLGAFAMVFFLYMVAGLRGATAVQQLQAGVLAAFWAGLVSALIASAGTFLFNYAFMEPSVAQAVFGAEFASSEVVPFLIFTMQTTLSVVLMHMLLIGPIFGVLLGFIGALAGRMCLRSDRTITPATY
jgi:hypothetical protein